MATARAMRVAAAALILVFFCRIAIAQSDLDWIWEEDDDPPPPAMGKVVVSVDEFGATGDGAADDTPAFQLAWDEACSRRNAVFLVPGGGGRRYKINATRFAGPCEANLIVQVEGKIVAPEDPAGWDPDFARSWLVFSQLAGVRIQGAGVVDGSGSRWWASSCKINKTNPCRGAPTALTLERCTGVRLSGLTVQNAQQMHVAVLESESVRVTGVRVRSPPDSPNTDGIHIAGSSAITVTSCRIAAGDDCISIVNGSFGVRMKGIECGPGHGISIGSLGKGNSSAAVRGIVLDTATLTGTTNGLRIKTWQGGSGYVTAVRFENVRMFAVANPIIIDQFYCDSATPCKNQTLAVKISNVVYRNVTGTSATASAMTFRCSDTVPCSSIVLRDIDLERADGGGEGDAETVCNCAMGIDYGHVRPAADCLRSGECGGGGRDAAAAADGDYLRAEL